MNEWVQIISTVGFPIALILIVLGAVGMALWKGLPWIAEKVIAPVTTAHLKLVETLDRSIEQSAESGKVQAESMAKMAKSLEQLEAFMSRHQAFAEVMQDDAEAGRYCRAKDRNNG